MKGLAQNIQNDIENFCKIFGYKREELPQYEITEDISAAKFLSLTNDFFLIPEMVIHGEYNKELHINRVCSAIAEGEFPYKLSRMVKGIYREHKKKKWEFEKRLYGARLRWQIRINRLTGLNIRIPTLDEIISHKILRFFSVLSCLRSRRKHLKTYGSLDDFSYLDRRYGAEINVRGVQEVSLMSLLFPFSKKKVIEVQKTKFHKKENTESAAL